MIPDGMGPPSVTMARICSEYMNGSSALTLDSILKGTIRTRSHSSLVTDSAAAGTAYSCGIKTTNGIISMTPDLQPCASIFEAARWQHGIATGLVVTSRISHATPAVFSAHVDDRNNENEIAAQQLYAGLDVMFGGGMDFYTPTSAGGKRKDHRDLRTEAAQQGYTLVQTPTELQGDLSLPVIGLFGADHLAYDVDRDPAKQPSLAEMSAKAIGLLDAKARSSGKGFIMMIEGSRIDHAGHDNDPVSNMHDTLAFDKAVKVAVDYARSDGTTLVVIMADHETGGLSLGRMPPPWIPPTEDTIYIWYPDVLTRISKSVYKLARAVNVTNGVDGPQIAAYIQRETGFTDLSTEEINNLAMAAGALPTNGNAPKYEELLPIQRVIAGIVSLRANTGWSSYGHSGVDINLYAFGPGSELFQANHDNTEVPHILSSLLSLDLDKATSDLLKKGIKNSA